MARAEVGYGVLLVSAFVLPTFIGYRAWIPALALATGVAALHGALSGRKPVVPAVLLAYLVIYLIAGLHSDPDTFSVIEAGKYFAPPVFALAIAWACLESATTRLWIVAMGVVAVAIQVPVVVVQVFDLFATYGSAVTNQTDEIVGLLGPYQGAPLTQCGLVAAALLFSAGYVGWLRRPLAIAGGLVAVSIALLTSTRASYVFVPATLLTLAASVWIVRIRGRSLPIRPLVAAALPVILLPILFFGTAALYPGANDSLNTVGGVSASLFEGDQQLAGASTGGGSQANGGSPEADTSANNPPPQQQQRPLTVLPGRARQLTLALELSVDEGPDVTLLGRGIGSTRFKNQGLLSATGQTSDLVTRPEQKTNSVWIARTISETGYLGLLGFFGLLAYMVVLFWRNIDLLSKRDADAAILLALPAVAALTLVSATYNTILAIQSYATLFWALLGVAIAIDAGRRRRADEART